MSISPSAAALAALIGGSADFRELLTSALSGRHCHVSGITESATPVFLATLLKRMAEDSSPVVICKDEKACRSIAGALSSLGVRCETFPARDYNFNNITASREFEHERLRVLSALSGGERFVTVTTPQAFLQPTLTKDELLARELFLECGGELPPTVAVEILEEGGYVRADVVEGPGQYALRGGILDIHSPTAAIRAEFFGDEIDRLGFLDPATQRITENVGDSVLIPP